MRPTRLLIAAATLALVTSACGADNPEGTISQDDLPGDVKVSKVVTDDDQAGQLTCTKVNDAEDNHVMTPSENYDRDLRATVSYNLSGGHREQVSNSVWRLPQPKDAVAAVAAGIDECAKGYESQYKRFDVEGYPDALGYIGIEGSPTPTYTRRILVPLKDRVVIVTTTREGDDDFTVAPEDLLKQAIAASKDAPEA